MVIPVGLDLDQAVGQVVMGQILTMVLPDLLEMLVRADPRERVLLRATLVMQEDQVALVTLEQPVI